MTDGAAIANGKGVPGTLACVCWSTWSAAPLLLSTWHVLFGGGADEETPVWSLEAGVRRARIGTTKHGTIGTVRLEGDEYYIDCAVAVCSVDVMQPRVTAHAPARAGMRVRKAGAATGITYGTITHVTYEDQVCVEHRTYAAPRQILIRPDAERPFSAQGDSGAAVVDDEGRVVGLLWGTNARGEGLACHIEPVLRILDVRLCAS